VGGSGAVSGILWFLFLLTAIFIIVIVAGIFWSIKSGQFDDLEGPAERILMDEDDPMLPSNQKLKDKSE
jgi:cbb3-type cytochrome oxidase maturation protein